MGTNAQSTFCGNGLPQSVADKPRAQNKGKPRAQKRREKCGQKNRANGNPPYPRLLYEYEKFFRYLSTDCAAGAHLFSPAHLTVLHSSPRIFLGCGKQPLKSGDCIAGGGGHFGARLQLQGGGGGGQCCGRTAEQAHAGGGHWRKPSIPHGGGGGGHCGRGAQRESNSRGWRNFGQSPRRARKSGRCGRSGRSPNCGRLQSPPNSGRSRSPPNCGGGGGLSIMRLSIFLTSGSCNI